jgi:hypothetical protein
MAGTQVVIDLSKAPSVDAKAVLEFFETFGRKLVAAETAAGVRHHVTLSHGWDRSGTRPRPLPRQGGSREADRGLRYPIHDHPLDPVPGIPRRHRRCEYGWKRRQACARFFFSISPRTTLLASSPLATPRNGIVEVAGAERAPFNQIVAHYLEAVGDPRKVVKDPEARHFGARLEERSLVPLGEARLGQLNLEEWLRRPQKRP